MGIIKRGVEVNEKKMESNQENSFSTRENVPERQKTTT